MTDQDEKPETETAEAAEKAGETVADAKETATEAVEHPEPEAKKTADSIPEWGQELIAKVEDIAAAVSKPVEEGSSEVPGMPAHGDTVGDDTPVRRPWHKRGFYRD